MISLITTLLLLLFSTDALSLSSRFTFNRLPFSHSFIHPVTRTTTTLLKLSQENTTPETTETDFIPERTVQTPVLTPEDQTIIDQIYTNSDNGTNTQILETLILQYLPQMQASLVVSLRNAAAAPEEDDPKLHILGKTLQDVLDTQLESGRDLLQSFLKSGEIRKLDGAIGKAAREGKLDMAFFTVMNMNIQDAYRDGDGKTTTTTTTTTTSEGEQQSDTNRLQILQHIYTRCQEEVEKAVDPGVGLLNKLLRTDVKSIRDNQIRYYLGPQEEKITTPDGKELELKGGKPLVSLGEFLDAIEKAVTQIRDVEKAGGTDRVTAANLVEECRQVAIEARLIILDVYGEGSEELKEFEEKLEPVFRPSRS